MQHTVEPGLVLRGEIMHHVHLQRERVSEWTDVASRMQHTVERGLVLRGERWCITVMYRGKEIARERCCIKDATYSRTCFWGPSLCVAGTSPLFFSATVKQHLTCTPDIQSRYISWSHIEFIAAKVPHCAHNCKQIPLNIEWMRNLQRVGGLMVRHAEQVVQQIRPKDD